MTLSMLGFVFLILVFLKKKEKEKTNKERSGAEGSRWIECGDRMVRRSVSITIEIYPAKGGGVLYNS